MARAVEAQLLSTKLVHRLDELSDNVRNRELSIIDNLKWEPASWPTSAAASGFHEAAARHAPAPLIIVDRKIPMRLFGVAAPWLGGLQSARVLHHAGMWLLAAFALIYLRRDKAHMPV